MANQRDPHPGKGNEPEHAHGNKPPHQAEPKSPEELERDRQRDAKQSKNAPRESQKSQIVQYFKSQGKEPDDVIFSLAGLDLTLKDLEGG